MSSMVSHRGRRKRHETNSEWNVISCFFDQFILFRSSHRHRHCHRGQQPQNCQTETKWYATRKSCLHLFGRTETNFKYLSIFVCVFFGRFSWFYLWCGCVAYAHVHHRAQENNKCAKRNGCKRTCDDPKMPQNYLAVNLHTHNTEAPWEPMAIFAHRLSASRRWNKLSSAMDMRDRRMHWDDRRPIINNIPLQLAI